MHNKKAENEYASKWQLFPLFSKLYVGEEQNSVKPRLLSIYWDDQYPTIELYAGQ